MARGTAAEGKSLEELREVFTANSQEDAVNGVLAAFNASENDASWRIDVHQIVGSSREGVKEPYIFTIDISEVEGIKAKLQDECGPGRYRAHVFLNKKKFGQFDLDIGAKPRAREDVPVLRALPAPAGNDMLLEQIRAMQAEQRDFNKLLIEGLTRMQAPAAPSPLTGITEVAAIMRTFQELMPKPDPEANFKLFTAGVELAQKMAGGGGGGETGILDVIKEVFSSDGAQQLLGAVAQNVMAGKPGAAPAPATIEGQRTPPPVAATRPAAAAIETSNGTLVPPALRQVMIYLIDRAAAGADPVLSAEYVLNNLPPAVLDQVGEMPDAVTTLATVFPRVATYRPWFDALLDKIFEPEDGEPEETEAPPPDASPAVTDDRSAGGAAGDA